LVELIQRRFGGKRFSLHYSEDDLRKRGKLIGSARALMDRRKFAAEFDPTQLLAELDEESREIYRKNPHIQQVS